MLDKFRDTFIKLIEYIGSLNSNTLRMVDELDFNVVIRLSKYKDYSKLFIFSYYDVLDISDFICRRNEAIFVSLLDCTTELMRSYINSDLEYISLKDAKVFMLDMETLKISEVELD